jgi:uncharacterized peroxidase-related enzyme
LSGALAFDRRLAARAIRFQVRVWSKPMKIFPSLPDEPQLSDVYRRFPHTLPPLLEYHDRLMCDPSPLTVGERELIASYVSGLNACTFCHGAHKVAAGIYGIDEAVIDALMIDIDGAPIDDRLKPILRYVRKLNLTPSRITEADAGPVFAAGWDEQALFDAISVCALYNFMNRIVEGSGIKYDPLPEGAAEREARRQRHAGEAGSDPHRSGRRYGRLLEAWGIAPSQRADAE